MPSHRALGFWWPQSVVLLEEEQRESTRRPPRGRKWEVRYQRWGLITLLSTDRSLQETSGFRSEAAGSCGQGDRRVGERGGGPGFRETDPDVGFSAMSIKAMEGKTFSTIKEE